MKSKGLIKIYLNRSGFYDVLDRKILSIFYLLLFLTSFTNCKILDLHNSGLNDIFIAHAGGAIDSLTYSNSLEALNSSYKKGCRLFELDIIETSDGKYVAAHDWSVFKQITDYPSGTDETPLTEDQFLSLRIYKKYTPLNMQRINDWFSDHNDAILVTDKVNSPKRFSEAFLFKNRLRMELFTWDAVNEAIQIRVTPMPSECLVLEQNAEKRLYDLKIRYIAISRRSIDANKDFLNRLKAHKIRTYVYHVNFDKGKDEKYVLENEMEYIYGMYADYLDLINK
jgi:lipoteichoic acid synthase